MKRKMIAFTAAVCMTAALIPTASFAEGEAITRAYIENGNTVAEVNAESGTVIAADYTGGALTAVKYADVSDAVNGTVTIEGIEADKVFLWDSLAGMTPLCAPVIVGGTDESPSPAPTATTEATVSPSPSAEPDASASPEPTSAPTAEATTTPLPTPTTGATATPTPTAIATVSPSPTPTTEVTTSPAPTATTEATVLPTPTPTTEATVSPMPTPTTEATVSPMPTPTIGATVSPSPSVEPDVTESPSPTTIPTILPEKIYDDWLQGQANDTSTDGLKEVTEYEGKTALGVCRNVYKLYGETMVSGASMTFETYAYYASGSAGFRIVLESASASEAQNSGKIVEAVTAGSDGKFGTAGETTLTSTKTGWFKAVVKVSYSGTDPTVTASLYDPDGAAVFENTNVPVPSDVTDKNVKAIRLVSRESADSGIYTYFADMDASFTGAATPDPSVPTPSPKPTPHPTAPPKATTAPTAEPTFPTVNIPESKAWTVNDTALNEKVLAVTTKGEALEPYDGLNGYGEWTNLNVTELKYTHNGTAYTFTHCWQAGTGSATERNFYFTPEAECTVTVAYQSPKKETDTSDRPLYICQGGVDETNRLITGTDPGTDAAPAEMSVNITDTSKGDVYIVGGSSNKYVYGIFVDYKQSKLYGTITHEGGTDMEGAKIVFTDASDPNNKYEVDFAATYAIAVENGKTYNVSVVDADGAEIAGLQPVTSTVTVNGETRHDVKIADLNSTLVTGDVVVHEYTPNDDTTLDLSGVTLKFTDKTDNTVYTANKIENNRYSALLKPGKTYTVTAENTEGYTLSPLSGEYALPSGETGCFKNILLTENLGTVPFDDTIEVGWDRTYTRINDAVAAIKNMTNRPSGEDGRVTILLDNGVYQEQAIIDADYVTLKAAIEEYKPIITFYYGIGYRYYSASGESGDDTAHASGGYYDEDLAVQKTKKGNVDRWGPVVRVTGNYFKAENVIFANSFNCQIVQAELDDGVEPSIYSDTNSKPDRTAKNFDPLTTSAVERAAAMAADGNNYEFKNCEFISSQDTLFTNNVGYFKDCYIEGGTDYIFGGNSVIFDNCTLAWHGYTGNAKGGYITACKTAETPTAGTPNLKANGYLMRNCTVTKSKYYKHSFEAGGWGRNWGGENCQVVFDGVTIASGTDVPGTWVAMRKAEENKPFSFSILYVNNVKKADGTAVNSSGTDFNPNGTMSSNGYTVMSDEEYFGEWTPSYYAN